MKYVLLFLLSIGIAAHSSARELACWKDGVAVGDAEYNFRQIRKHAIRHDDIEVWIVFNMAFEPNDANYPSRLDAMNADFEDWLIANNLENDFRASGGHGLAPGRFGYATKKGLNALKANPNITCISPIE